MESLIWGIRSRDAFLFAWPIALTLIVTLTFMQSDFFLLLARELGRRVLGRDDGFRPGAPGSRPSAMVIIPSLLRGRDDLDAITLTVESCAANEFPSELVIVASVDGRTEHPALYAELNRWAAALERPANVQVYVTGTETRLGKMMAVEAGVHHVRALAAAGTIDRMPDVYVSIDGDGTLGPNALERLVARLSTPHPITGNLRRIVSGKIYIRPDLVWNGWGAFFGTKGFIHAQVAREFLVSNVARFNWKLTPKIGVPGALYCTWTDLLLKAPSYMGFMQTLTVGDWLRWWAGRAPPRFSESTAPPLPEALTGASDDTCMAFLASIATWKDGRLDFDAPRTPLHAFFRLLRSYTWERSHDYEPEARVYTYTPTTWKGLWTQRVRWNSSRFECAGRFWRAFMFHWEIGFPVGAHLSMVLRGVLEVTAYYLLLPYALVGEERNLLAYGIGYVAQTLGYTLYTLLALALERDRRAYWRVLACLPFAPIYLVCINFFGCVYGVTKDLLLFGNTTSFAPEWTLKKSRCERVALAFRVRRFLSLCVRALVRGDVPFGRFWWGWDQTRWTPSGFEGWTTGKSAPSILFYEAPVDGPKEAPIAESLAAPLAAPIATPIEASFEESVEEALPASLAELEPANTTADSAPPISGVRRIDRDEEDRKRLAS